MLFLVLKTSGVGASSASPGRAKDGQFPLDVAVKALDGPLERWLVYRVKGFCRLSRALFVCFVLKKETFFFVCFVLIGPFIFLLFTLIHFCCFHVLALLE